jgi:hypothetical protein
MVFSKTELLDEFSDSKNVLFWLASKSNSLVMPQMMIYECAGDYYIVTYYSSSHSSCPYAACLTGNPPSIIIKTIGGNVAATR